MTIKEISEKYGITADTLRYYERVGMIPPVPRTESGIRNYDETSCGWVELAICMRSAGLPIEAMIEYVSLTQQGSKTVAARLDLLEQQRERLLDQQAKIAATLDRLNYKIGIYEEAVHTGNEPVWSKEEEAK